MIRKLKDKVSNKENIKYLILFLYFVSISAYRLGEGFDALFVRIIFIIIIGYCLLKNIRHASFSKAFLWNLAFWALYFTSATWAKNPEDTFTYTALAIQILGVFLIIPEFTKDKQGIEKVLKILQLSLLYTALLVIIRTPFNYFGTERIGGIIGLNANAFGLRMATGAIISLYLSKANMKHKKIIYLICVILLSALALLSGSKKALVALIIGLPALEITSSKGRKRVTKIAGMLLTIFFAFYMIFANPLLYKTIGYRLEETYYTVTEQTIENNKMTDISLIKREYFKKEAIDLFKQNPILGYGGNNFRTHLEEIGYYDPTYSHNNYTELLSTLGIVGMITYYSFWILALVKMAKMTKTKHGKLALLFCILIISYLVLDYGLVSYLSEMNAIIIALASAFIDQYYKKEQLAYAK